MAFTPAMNKFILITMFSLLSHSFIPLLPITSRQWWGSGYRVMGWLGPANGGENVKGNREWLGGNTLGPPGLMYCLATQYWEKIEGPGGSGPQINCTSFPAALPDSHSSYGSFPRINTAVNPPLWTLCYCSVWLPAQSTHLMVNKEMFEFFINHRWNMAFVYYDENF